jgi:hypothetical protein
MSLTKRGLINKKVKLSVSISFSNINLLYWQGVDENPYIKT